VKVLARIMPLESGEMRVNRKGVMADLPNLLPENSKASDTEWYRAVRQLTAADDRGFVILSEPSVRG
jgi:hypothetical protein